MSIWNNYGMGRRHFMQHMATAAATLPAMNFLSHVQANAAALKARNKSCILMWMSGGPPTIDIWDLKPLTPSIPLLPVYRSVSTCRKPQRSSKTFLLFVP